MKTQTPLFILGVPRSGTTLVRSLMQVMDGAYFPPDEFQLLPVILRSGFDLGTLPTLLDRSNFAGHMRRRALWPDAQGMVEVQEAPNGAKAIEALVLRIAALDAVTKPRYWGDKTPENVFHLDLIFATWPQARVIHVRRDPRDTVLSMRASWGRSIVRGAMIWRDGLRAYAAQASGASTAQIFDISYEDLTRHPEAELTRLAHWLDLSCDFARLDGFTTEERWSSVRGDGIQDRGARWRAALTEMEVRQIESICFAEMKAAGYAPEYARSQSEPTNVQLRLAKFGDALRVLRAYIRERGLIPALHYKIRQWINARKV